MVHFNLAFFLSFPSFSLFVYLFIVVFETGSYFIVQASLKLSIFSKNTEKNMRKKKNFPSSHLSLLSAGITEVCHHSWLHLFISLCLFISYASSSHTLGFLCLLYKHMFIY